MYFSIRGISLNLVTVYAAYLVLDSVKPDSYILNPAATDYYKLEEKVNFTPKSEAK